MAHLLSSSLRSDLSLIGGSEVLWTSPRGSPVLAGVEEVRCLVDGVSNMLIDLPHVHQAAGPPIRSVVAMAMTLMRMSKTGHQITGISP